MEKRHLCTPTATVWELWRQDDNGNRFLVGRYERKSEAEAKLAEVSRVQHKQTYWIGAVEFEQAVV